MAGVLRPSPGSSRMPGGRGTPRTSEAGRAPPQVPQLCHWSSDLQSPEGWRAWVPVPWSALSRKAKQQMTLNRHTATRSAELQLQPSLWPSPQGQRQTDSPTGSTSGQITSAWAGCTFLSTQQEKAYREKPVGRAGGGGVARPPGGRDWDAGDHRPPAGADPPAVGVLCQEPGLCFLRSADSSPGKEIPL